MSGCPQSWGRRRGEVGGRDYQRAQRNLWLVGVTNLFITWITVMVLRVYEHAKTHQTAHFKYYSMSIKAIKKK